MLLRFLMAVDMLVLDVTFMWGDDLCCRCLRIDLAGAYFVSRGERVACLCRLYGLHGESQPKPGVESPEAVAK